jgi:hypothetical protein
MHRAHSFINVAACHGMSNLGFSSLSGTSFQYGCLYCKPIGGYDKSNSYKNYKVRYQAFHKSSIETEISDC